ncbi:MAG: hypothetical protein EA339_10015 [Rhodobacteraceae bacterium]|nr:MAG: hypothetical protein EA339_10015 [Paracoccaceae bacterium]
MTPPRHSQFLARDSYRLRRLMDAVRLLPALGLLLFLLPLMRRTETTQTVVPPSSPGTPATAQEAVFLFLVWAGLVLAALLMSRGLRHALDVPTRADEADKPAPEE